jgi:pimeloyl-ACP methyl ester carboxylesterase
MLKKISLAIALAITGIGLGQPARAETGKIALEPCEYKIGGEGAETAIPAMCGTLEVPADWSDSSGATITLKVVVLEAENDDKREPIFHIEGGPGASAIEAMARSWYPSYLGLRLDHDIIIMDQRGTGESTSIACTEMDDNAYKDLALDATTPEYLETVQKRLATCLTRISKTLDPQFVNSVSLSKDINAMREALGYDKINLFGSSYGAWLAQVYLREFPQTVHAAIIEGTVGPWDQPWLVIGNYYDVALQKAFDLCEADKACNEAYPNLRTTLDEVVANLEAEPVKTTGSNTVTGESADILITKDRFLGALQVMLNQGALIGSVPQAVTQAAKGNFPLISTILISLAEPNISTGMYWSVVCSENVPFFTETQLKEARTDAYYGLATPLVDLFLNTCKIWRSAELDESAIAALETDLPVMIFSGEFDSQTPPFLAANTAERLANDIFVSFPYEGHGVMIFNRCAQKLAVSFFNDPTAKLDTSCASQNVKPAFSGLGNSETESVTINGDSLTIPKGWKQVDNAEESGLAFFTGTAENSGTLALGKITAANAEEALSLSEALVLKQFGGSLFRQAKINQFGTLIVQYSYINDEDAYTAVMVVLAVGAEPGILWYASPTNTFSPNFEAIFQALLNSLIM